MRCSSQGVWRQTPAIRASRIASRTRDAARTSCMAAKKDVNSHDLLIVGPGVLGTYQVSAYTCAFRLKARGFEVRTADEAGGEQFPFVAFTAPPSQNSDYPAAIRTATQRWDGTGSMAYSGVASVYKTTDGPCDENDELQSHGSSERIDRLLNAEAAMLDAGGNVVRLVGLYHKTRGPHTFFIQKGTVERNGESVVNMIHYEDAARLLLAVLQGDGSDSEFYRGQAFTGSDNKPLTFRKMMDAVAESGVLEGSVDFTGTDKPSGKLMDSSQTDERLGFAPKYGSFDSFFLENKGADFYHDD